MGPTQFGCPYCPLIAKSSRNINRHMFTHTGVKPFLCQFCDYSSHRKDQLKSHMTNKHKDIFELWLFWFNWKFDCNSTEIEIFYTSEIFDFRILLFKSVPNYMVAHIVKRWWLLPTIWKGISWFILEKNHLVVNFALILLIKRAT